MMRSTIVEDTTMTLPTPAAAAASSTVDTPPELTRSCSSDAAYGGANAA